MASSARKARKARAQPQAMECSLAMPTIRPFLPSSSLAFTTGSMANPLRWQYRCRVFGDHPFLVGRHDPGRDARRRAADHAGPLGVGGLVDLDAEPSAALDHFGACRRVVLADAAGEDHAIEAAQGGNQRADLAADAIDEEGDR